MSLNYGVHDQHQRTTGVFGHAIHQSEGQAPIIENVSVPLPLPSNFDSNAMNANAALGPPTPYLDGTKPPSLNDYAMGPVLGIGTYGEVRSAIHLQTGKQIALKIVDLARFRPDTAALMLKEISILRRLNHPNCIGVMHVMKNEPFTGTFCSECACTMFRRSRANPAVCLSCSHESTHHKPQPISKPVLVIAQELAPGGELFSLLMHGGAIPEPIARHFFAQLLAAIEHCHQREVVHRDIKPENIVFDRHNRLKLVDFGLAACVADKPEGSIERTLAVLHSGVGSKPYSAPEVSYTREMYNATGYKGKPADIWSCAVVLFVMLTGRPPFYRPLLKTFNSNLQKCKHFARIIKGQGYEGVPPLARDLLMTLFKLNPDDRLSIEQIRQHPWMTQPMEGPYGMLPLEGVNSKLECESVYDHAVALMHRKAQRDALLLAQGIAIAPNEPKQSLDTDIDYTLSMPDLTGSGIPMDKIIQQRQSYQNLVLWMRSRVRAAWAAMERPDMVHALETAFAQDESLALDEARRQLVESAKHVHQASHSLQAGIGSVFGVPPSPVVVPASGPAVPGLRGSFQLTSAAPANNSFAPSSPSQAMLPPLSSQPPSILAQPAPGPQTTPNGAGRRLLSASASGQQSSAGPFAVPLNMPPADVPSPIPIPLPGLQQQSSNPASTQPRVSREVAGTPLATPLLTPLSPNFSFGTPGYSPAPSPAVFSKLGMQQVPPMQGYYPHHGGLQGAVDMNSSSQNKQMQD